MNSIKELTTAQCLLGIVVVLAGTYLLATGKANIEIENDNSSIKLTTNE